MSLESELESLASVTIGHLLERKLLSATGTELPEAMAIISQALLFATRLPWRPINEIEDGTQGVFWIEDPDGSIQVRTGTWRASASRAFYDEDGSYVGEVVSYLPAEAVFMQPLVANNGRHAESSATP